MAAKIPRRVLVGVIGAGEVAQVVHLPTLALHNKLFKIVSICDVSISLASHCAQKFHIPTHSTSPTTLLANPSIELIFILASDEYHESLCISSLRSGKSVFIEKPLSLSLASVQRIKQVEQEVGGNKVFVGYMRRYARSFTDVFLNEVDGIDRILYARVRDIIGPNSHFIGQSGTNPVYADDIPSAAVEEKGVRARELVGEVFEGGGEVKVEESSYVRFLCGLGSHDFSLMREAIGFPESVQAVSADGSGFYTAMLNFRNQKGAKELFTVTYESGIDTVPRFDAHLAVYGESKSVSVEYDTPYVKGLAVKVVVEERGDMGERVRREVIGSLEDAYTVQLKEVWDWVAEGKKVKTSVADAEGDARLVGMMAEKLREQRGSA